MSSLVTLSIENFVLIKQAQIEFAGGLNIISGQTGAGKSLLLKALMFILGERLNASQVLGRDGKKASVEAYFEIDSEALRQDLRELGLPEDWDGEELILSRSMDSSGRSRVRIAGRLATLTTLRALSKRLVSILSQHAYQQLVKPELQNRVLDHFGHHFQTWTKFQELRNKALQVKTELDDLQEHQESQQAYLQRARDDFEVLEALQPKEEEFEDLSQEAETLRRAEELREVLLTVMNTLSESDHSMLSALHGAERRLEKISDVLPSLGGALDALENARDELNEAVFELSRSEQQIQDDPMRLAHITERLGKIKDVSRRLRVPAEQLPEEYERLSQIVGDDVSEQIRKLEQSLVPILKELWQVDQELSAQRLSSGCQLEETMLQSLDDLGMDKARFEVRMPEYHPPKSYEHFPLPPAGGSAQVEFFLAANPGDELHPLGKVASGGELSRVMLALQRHLGKALDVALLVFDEIDQNVGGRLGPVIGRELAALGQERQVLVISHLPQVAAFAEKHVLAEKHSNTKNTETRFKEVAGDDRLRELAAMTRGTQITPTALNEAKELLEQARTTIREQVAAEHARVNS